MIRMKDECEEARVKIAERIKNGDRRLDRAIGCMLGGAAGDALGYPVEFMYYEEIKKRYGANGIRNYELTSGKAQISDDTQMSIFTATGILTAIACEAMDQWHYIWDEMDRIRERQPGAECDDIQIQNENFDPTGYVRIAYKDWLVTQGEIEKDPMSQVTWVLDRWSELYSRRCPGATCITSIKSGKTGNIGNPCNDSKGCGGVMRVAPAGIALAKMLKPKRIAVIGAKIAAITHGHALGYIPAAAMTHMIAALYIGAEIKEAIFDAVRCTSELFSQTPHVDEFEDIMSFATALSDKNIDDAEAIAQIGEGWVAEETLAIAAYCALKHKDDFAAGIRAAVNHSGDSDSTGAVTGNILGTYLGYSNIPPEFLQDLELRDKIAYLALTLGDVSLARVMLARHLDPVEYHQMWFRYIQAYWAQRHYL